MLIKAHLLALVGRLTKEQSSSTYAKIKAATQSNRTRVRRNESFMLILQPGSK